LGRAELGSAADELNDPQFAHGKELIALVGIACGDRVLIVGIDPRRRPR
jgi:hypothetical protein